MDSEIVENVDKQYNSNFHLDEDRNYLLLEYDGHTYIVPYLIHAAFCTCDDWWD